MKKSTHVVIVVRGGMVDTIYSDDKNLSIEIIDFDTEDEFEAEEAYTRLGDVESEYDEVY